MSTAFKTATDLTTGTTASSDGAPGGATTGTANPGDTIKWAVSYQSNSPGSAVVDLKDPLADAGTYVPGSLQLSPNPNPARPFSPQFTTDGTTWQAGEPPAGAAGVGLTGSFPTGSAQRSVPPTAPVVVNLTNSAGDGYNAVSSADGSLVYAVFHHTNSNTNVFCATTAGALCPGWPAGSNISATYVSPVAGTPIGTGPNGMMTAWEDGTFVADGNVYWSAVQNAAVGGLYPAGMMCLNLTTLQSCGFTQLGTTARNTAMNGTGIPAADGNYYYVTSAGTLLCFDPAVGSCGTIALPGVTATVSIPTSMTFGRYVFFQVLASTAATTTSLFCYDTSTQALCPGFPAATSIPTNQTAPNSQLSPILDSSGALTGVCANNATTQYGCWNLSGASVANPYPAGAGWSAGFAGDPWIYGARVYVPVNSGNSVGCFDFSQPLVGGKVQACTGFVPRANAINYTVRAMTGNATCLLADGDGRLIASFDAFSGGPCSTTTSTMTLSPVDYYCGSGVGGFQSWGALSITGAPAGSYSVAVVSLTDANGDPVAGFTDVQLTPGQSLDLSSIATTAPTNALSAEVTFRSATAAITGAQVGMTWVGDAPQLCFETIVPEVACGQTSTVSNEAVAVTDATAAGGGTDAPAGNSTGVAAFTVEPRADQCSLQFSKTASPDPAVPGATVTYTVTVTNAGSLPYSGAVPATFTDDLSDVLSGATYNDDASASTGTVSYAEPVLTWVGPGTFAPGATATISYTVTVADAGAGSNVLTNRVVSDVPGSTCPAGSTDAACQAPPVPINSLALVKQGTPNEVAFAGEVITYSYLVTNTGNQTLSDIAVTDTQSAPAGGLDGPIVCPDTTLAPLASTTCTATYTLTQADVDAGTVINTAVAHGTPPKRADGTTPPAVDSPEDRFALPAPAGPDLRLIKSASPASVSAPGQTVTYSFLVTNTGNVTLTGITVAETQFSGTGTAPVIDCPQAAAALAPLSSVTCTADYTTTQADIDAGGVTNEATATGTSPTQAQVVSEPWAAVVNADQAPALELAKTADRDTVTAAGQAIGYSFQVTNTGNVTLTDITIDETRFSGTGTPPVIDCPQAAASLAPAASVTCTADYITTQADIDSDGITNTATATGTIPDPSSVTSEPSTVVVATQHTPGLQLAKTADRDSITAAGQTIGYSFQVTNTGNTTLTDITIDETQFSGTGTPPAIDCPPAAASLAPAASVTCTADYTTTQADIDSDGVTNEAAATGAGPGQAPVTSEPSAVVVDSEHTPGLQLLKTADRDTVTAAGQTIAYSFAVTNTGNVTLTDVTVDETQFSGTGALAVDCPQAAASLAPAATIACTASYVVTTADAEAGSITNEAIATGTAPNDDTPVQSAPSRVDVTVDNPLAPILDGIASTGSRVSILGTLALVALSTAAGAAILVIARMRRRRQG